MKNIFYAIIGLGAVALLYFGFGVVSRERPQPDQQAGQSDFGAKTDDHGEGTVKVTPQALGGAEWRFSVVFDTHSVDLNQDLMRIAVLTDDRGKEYTPSAWEGAGPGGHHREGVLVFKAVTPASYIELKIKDIGGVPERSFKWNLQ